MREVTTNQEMLDKFYWWMYERMEIWHRRFILKKPAPWTRDKIMQKYNFLNVYRQLDRNSLWEIVNIIENPSLCDEDIFFNIFIFRLFNYLPTVKNLELPLKYYEFDYDLFKSKLLLQEKKRIPIFTPTTMMLGKSGQTKAEMGASIVKSFYDSFMTYFKKIKNSRKPEDISLILQKIWGIGNFLGWEIYTSLTQTPIIKWSENDWVYVFTGAQRGADLIFPDLVGEGWTYEDICLKLRDEHKEHFGRLGLHFRYIPNEYFPNPLYEGEEKYHEKDKFTLRTIENSLCEFRKYVNSSKGNIKGRRKLVLHRDTESLLEQVRRVNT